MPPQGGDLWQGLDGTFWAEVRELPGCFASGASIAELIEALREAVALYLTTDGPVIAAAPTVASVMLVVPDEGLQPA
jgi:predicted RNase H-like HicB family nuclease